MALLPLVSPLQEEPFHGEDSPHAQRPFCRSKQTALSPVNTTLDPCQKWSKGWSGCEALGGKACHIEFGFGAISGLGHHPHEEELFKSMRLR